MTRIVTIVYILLVFMWGNHDFLDGSYHLSDWIKVIDVIFTNIVVIGIACRLLLSEVGIDRLREEERVNDPS